MADRAQASAAVDGRAIVVSIPQVCFPGVQGHAHFEGRFLGPVFLLVSSLQRACGSQGITGSGKDTEEAVAFSSMLQEMTLMLEDQAFSQRLIAGQGLSHGFGMCFP